MKNSQLYSPHQMKQLYKRQGQNQKPLTNSILDNIFIVGLIIIQACTLNVDLTAQLYNFQACTIDFSKINLLLSDIGHRYQGYLASVLYEMLIYEDNGLPNIDEIEGKVSYFINNSGKITLMNPMTNIQLRQFIAGQAITPTPTLHNSQYNNNQNQLQQFASPQKSHQHEPLQLPSSEVRPKGLLIPLNQSLSLASLKGSFVQGGPIPTLQSPQVHAIQNIQQKMMSGQCPLKSSNYFQNLRFNYTPIQQIQKGKSSRKVKDNIQLNEFIIEQKVISQPKQQLQQISLVQKPSPEVKEKQICLIQQPQQPQVKEEQICLMYQPSPQVKEKQICLMQQPQQPQVKEEQISLVQKPSPQVKEKQICLMQQPQQPQVKQEQICLMQQPQQPQVKEEQICLMQQPQPLMQPQQPQLKIEKQISVAQQLLPQFKIEIQVDDLSNKDEEKQTLQTSVSDVKSNQIQEDETMDESPMYDNLKQKMNALLQKLEKYEFENNIQDLVSNQKTIKQKKDSQKKAKKKELKKKKETMKQIITAAIDKEKKKKKVLKTESSIESFKQCTNALTQLKQKLQIDNQPQGSLLKNVPQYTYYTANQQIPNCFIQPKVQAPPTMRSYSQINERVNMNNHKSNQIPIIQINCNRNSQNHYQATAHPQSTITVNRKNYYPRQVQYANISAQQ